MDYLVPAWHDNLDDWAISLPQLNFDDATGVIRLLQSNHQQVGLMILDYQPNLLEKLSQLALSPQKCLSVFDYIQDIHHQEGQNITYTDFNWPQGARFEFGSFHLFIRKPDNSLYAKVYFSTTGRLLFVEYFNDQAELVRRLRVDSRGFISREEDYHPGNKKPFQYVYYDETGQWRINHHVDSGQVVVNPIFVNQFAHTTYDSMVDLVREIVLTKLMPQVYGEEDRLVVTLDDQLPVPPEFFLTVPTIFSASQWHPYQKLLEKNPGVANSPIVVDRKPTAEDVQRCLYMDHAPVQIPLFYSQFQLGHSQRTAQQIVAMFSEHLSQQQLMDMMERYYGRLLKNHKTEQLLILNYSGQKEAEAQAVLQEFCRIHEGEFHLHKEHPDMIEVKFKKKKTIPELFIKVIRLESVNTTLTILDQVRLIIDLSESPDEFLQMVSVSVGIPRLQRRETLEVHDHRNGLVVNSLDEMMDGISFYLDHLKNWNEALASNVQMLNKYSSSHLYKQWQTLWK